MFNKTKSDNIPIKSALLLIPVFILACGRQSGQHVEKRLFTLMPSSYTHAGFENKLDVNKQVSSNFNIYTYRNFYNGGGVALGDVNNDGLIDIFLTANMGYNVLYLNKGNFKFEDIRKSRNQR